MCEQLFQLALANRTSGGEAARSRKLVVHADNCIGENKNKYVLAQLMIFVILGWWDEVQMECMVAGHTHTDIDSCVFLTYNSGTDSLMTVFDVLVRRVVERYSKNSVFFDTIHNWKQFFEKNFRFVRGQGGPHQFVITRPAAACPHTTVFDKSMLHGDAQLPELFYRLWSTQEDQPLLGDPARANAGIQILKKVPEGMPSVLPRSWERRRNDFESIMSNGRAVHTWTH